MTAKVVNIDREKIRLRTNLESRLTELARLSAGREDIEIQLMADPIDQVRWSSDRDTAVETLNYHARSIHDIRAALARLEDGSYGWCEHCEELIAPKRLKALPWARMCVNCQSDAESEDRQGRMTFDYSFGGALSPATGASSRQSGAR